MSGSDRYAALFFVALGVFICQQSLGFQVGTLHRPGPGLLSFGAGAAVALLSLILLIQTFFSAPSAGEAEEDEGAGNRVRTTLICIALFLYVVAVDWLGFILATLFFVLFLFRTVESEPWWRSSVKAVLVTLGNYLVFVIWLGVRLPKGLLPW